MVPGPDDRPDDAHQEPDGEEGEDEQWGQSQDRRQEAWFGVRGLQIGLPLCPFLGQVRDQRRKSRNRHPDRAQRAATAASGDKGKAQAPESDEHTDHDRGPRARHLTRHQVGQGDTSHRRRDEQRAERSSLAHASILALVRRVLTLNPGSRFTVAP